MLNRIIFISLLISANGKFFSPVSKVIDLNVRNFDKKVLKSDKVWLVKFYAPWCGVSQDFATTYEKAANALDGVVNVGAVDVDKYRELRKRFGIKGYPTVKLFIGDKNKPVEFLGERNVRNIVNAAMSAIKKKVNYQMSLKANSTVMRNLVTLTDNNFNDLLLKSSNVWLVEFHAPWCDECRDIEIKLAEAAKIMKGKIRFGHTDATVNKMISQEFKIKKVPTIKYFLPGQKSEVFDYKTSNDVKGIVERLTQKLKEIKSPIIHQVVNVGIFDNCIAGNLCLITFLPHLLDCGVKCRKKYLDVLESAAVTFKGNSWKWIWVEGGQLSSLENVFEIGIFDYPGMIALNFKKKAYSTFKGSFSHKGITEFLQDVARNRVKTEMLKEHFDLNAIESPSEIKKEDTLIAKSITDSDLSNKKVEMNNIFVENDSGKRLDKKKIKSNGGNASKEVKSGKNLVNKQREKNKNTQKTKERKSKKKEHQSGKDLFKELLK